MRGMGELAMPGFEEAIRLGEQADAQGKIEESLAHFDQALQHRPGDAQTAMFRVAALLKLGRKEEGLAQCNQILMREPGNGPALWARATVFRELERYDDALADIDEAIRVQDAMIIYRLERGQILAVRGDHADAEKQLSDVMRRALEAGETVLMLQACQTIISIYRVHGLHEKADSLEAKMAQTARHFQGGGKKKGGCGSAAALLAFAPLLLNWLCR